MLDREAEREALLSVLDEQRDSLVYKLSGLSESEARAVPTASALSLLAIVKHSAVWERRWFQVLMSGKALPGEWPEQPDAHADASFDLDEADTLSSVIEEYRTQIAQARPLLEAVDLDSHCAHRWVSHRTARSIVLHMIEETARHAGHADIIRETIDGKRGPSAPDVA